MMSLLDPAIVIPALIFLFLALGYIGVPLWLWLLYFVLLLAAWNPPIWVWLLFSAIAAILNIPLLRRSLVTSKIISAIKAFNVLPNISATEQAAIEAGTVWVDGEFFSGQPNFQRINSEPYPQITPEIQAFLDGPVEQVCRMASDWEI
jgi:acyl-CoA dehydrogenase